MRYDKPSKSDYAAFGYLMTTLDQVELYGVTPIETAFCYKGLIFTPVGALKFDTCNHDIKSCAVSTKQAKDWLSRWVTLPRPYIKLTCQDLINNWHKFGLDTHGRKLEREVINRWDKTAEALQPNIGDDRFSRYLPTRLSFKIYERRQSI